MTFDSCTDCSCASGGKFRCAGCQAAYEREKVRREARRAACTCTSTSAGIRLCDTCRAAYLAAFERWPARGPLNRPASCPDGKCGDHHAPGQHEAYLARERERARERRRDPAWLERHRERDREYRRKWGAALDSFDRMQIGTRRMLARLQRRVDEDAAEGAAAQAEWEARRAEWEAATVEQRKHLAEPVKWSLGLAYRLPATGA